MAFPVNRRISQIFVCSLSVSEAWQLCTLTAVVQTDSNKRPMLLRSGRMTAEVKAVLQQRKSRLEMGVKKTDLVESQLLTQTKRKTPC